MKKNFFEKNYFEILSLPVSFSVDEVCLNERFKELQHLLHPDRHAGKTELEKRMVMQMASQINSAYQCLKNPVTRAEYLISLSGETIDIEKQTAHDLSFLEKQMAWRERLSANDSTLSQEITDTYQQYIETLAKGFAESWDKALLKKKILELRFIDKIIQELTVGSNK